MQKLPDQMKCPRILIRGRHRGEPHLPVKAQWIGSNLRRHFVQFDRKSLVRISLPFRSFVRHGGVGALKDNVETFTTDSSKRAVGIDQIEGVARSVHDLVW